jgi:hypothetical protein
LAFRLIHKRYDPQTRRAYVELRDTDPDGGEMVATANFSLRTLSPLTNTQLEREIVRNARQLLRSAAAAVKGEHERLIN